MNKKFLIQIIIEIFTIIIQEYFLDYFAKKSFNQSQSDKRRTVTYKDIGILMHII